MATLTLFKRRGGGVFATRILNGHQQIKKLRRKEIPIVDLRKNTIVWKYCMAKRHICYSIVNVKLVELCTYYSYISKRAPNGQQYSGQQYQMLVHLLPWKATFKNFVKWTNVLFKMVFWASKTHTRQKKLNLSQPFSIPFSCFGAALSLIYHYVWCYQVSYHGLFRKEKYTPRSFFFVFRLSSRTYDITLSLFDLTT